MPAFLSAAKAEKEGFAMLTPQQWASRWGRKPDPLRKFPKKVADRLAIHEGDRAFLIEAGLPESAAPFLSFEVPKSRECPMVSDLYGMPGELERYRSIGLDGSGNPIAIDEHANGEIVCLDHEDGFRRALMNSTVRQLAESILAYRDMLHAAISANGEDAWLRNMVPPAAIKTLKRELKRIDAEAVKKGRFWAQAIIDASIPYED
jgi:hypothetical protein